MQLKAEVLLDFSSQPKESFGFFKCAFICMFPNNILIRLWLKYWPQLAWNKRPDHLLENELCASLNCLNFLEIWLQLLLKLGLRLPSSQTMATLLGHWPGFAGCIYV